ncbi:MAG: retroviral-like aspartic protease family protein [Planctomycetia bacterium]|nr:retroviral-like aspartic protease family protein [Planctomycetia bacterium]
MGKVAVPAKIENLEDLFEVRRGLRPPDQVRSVDLRDAVVDTGATMLSLPRRLIQQLGLTFVRNRQGRTAMGLGTFGVYSVVQLTVQGRDCKVEVTEVPDDCPALIGQVPLELLDWVVDPINQRLIGNPEHGGQQMIDLF